MAKVPPVPGQTRRRRWFRRPFLTVAALVLAGYWTLAAAVIGFDLHDVYPWGVAPKVAPRHPFDRSMDLFAVAANDRASNFVLVGSSTTMPYTPDQIETIFPAARGAWNLSYPASRPVDRDVALRVLADSDVARHILISLDWTYVLDPGLTRTNFASYLYDGTPYNDLQMVDLDALRAIWDHVRGMEGGVSADAYQKRLAQRRQVGTNRWGIWHAPDRLAEIRRAIAGYHPRLRTVGRRHCGDLQPVADQLIPALRRLSQKGNRVDILVPPYSPVIYYPIADSRDRTQLLGDSFLSDQLLLRRCVVTMAADIPNVAVWAPDKDLSLIADWNAFEDPAHIYDRDSLLRTLAAVGDERYRLTPANVDAYVAAMREFAIGYRLPDAPPVAPSD